MFRVKKCSPYNLEYFFSYMKDLNFIYSIFRVQVHENLQEK